jgi:hypothetical protein
VTILHSLYGTDGATQIIGGLGEELIRRLQDMGAARNWDPDGETGAWTISTEHAKLAADDLCVGSGVKLLFHTLLAGCVRDGRRVTAALIEGKSGRHAILARVFIDCTGDADLIRRAGLQTQLGDGHGRCQAPTLCFRVAGKAPDAVELWEVGVELSKTPMEYVVPGRGGACPLRSHAGPYASFLWGSTSLFDPSEEMLAGTRIVNTNAADTLDLSRAELEAHYQLRWVIERLRQMRGRENTYLVDIAAQLGIRETHRILAEHQLQREEVLWGKRFEDAIAQGTYPIDIHRPDGPGILFERLDGTSKWVGGDYSTEERRWDGQPPDAPRRDTLCYEVPYRCLIPRELDNVLVAGRCAGANHESAGAIRVMVNCMQLGQAAGLAAAMARDGGDVREVEGQALRERLREEGVPLRGAG